MQCIKYILLSIGSVFIRFIVAIIFIFVIIIVVIVLIITTIIIPVSPERGFPAITSISSSAAFIPVLIIIVPESGLLLPAEFMGPGGHGQGLRFGRLEAALWTRRQTLVFVVDFDAFSPHVIVAVTRLAPETRKLAVFIAGLAFQALLFHNLHV